VCLYLLETIFSLITILLCRRQASDQLYDGGGATREGTGDADADADLDIMFRPAEHTDSMKRRKEKKRRNKLNSVGSNTSSSGGSGSRKSAAPDAASTPRVKNSNRSPHGSPRSSHGSPQHQSPSQQYSSPLQRSGGSRNSNTPPSSTSAQRRPPKAGDNGHAGNNYGSNMNMEMSEEDDVWYAKWWMFCFPDTVQNMSPKR
jgi:hypothetical protein